MLPDHVPSSLHKRRRGPASRYPRLQVRVAWEPNKEPHEKAASPFIGGCRATQDIPVGEMCSLLTTFRYKNHRVAITNVSLVLQSAKLLRLNTLVY